jgi:hypothetical protein
MAKIPGDAQPSKKQVYTPRKSVGQKLEAVFNSVLGPQNGPWTNFCTTHSDFKMRRDRISTAAISALVSKFLGGEATHGPPFIVDARFRNADGRVDEGSEQSELMFSTTTPFADIKPVRSGKGTPFQVRADGQDTFK